MPLGPLQSAPPQDVFGEERRSRRRGRIAWFPLGLGSMAAIAALVHLAQLSPDQPLGDRGPETTASSAQAATAPEKSINAVEQTGTIAPSTMETAHPPSRARDDKWVHGVFESEAHYLRLVLRDPAQPVPSFFIELVRRAAEAGLGVIRSAQPARVATRFGPAEIAEVALADGLERACHAFRVMRPQGELAVHGWHCGPPDRPLERREIVCLIDRLPPQIDDRALKALVAAIERDGDVCAPRPAEPIAARTDSSSRRRGKARAADSASRDSRG
jgi:hypothetical protein